MSTRVVQIVQRMAPGGLEVLALKLSGSLSADATLLSLEGKRQELVRTWPRLEALAHRFDAFEKAPGLDPGLLWRLARALKRLRADVVLTHHAGPLIYGGVAARAVGVRKLIHVEHDAWHLESTRRARVMRFAAHALRPTIVGVSERMHEPLSRVYRDCSIRIIPNGVDIIPPAEEARSQARILLGLPLDATIIGAAGRLEEVKGHDLLIEAMTGLPPAALLVIAGDGSRLEHLQSQAARLGVAERVRFLGHRDDLDRIYPAFDIFCQPSRNEGLPLAILEAQARGVRVVASAVGDVPLGVCPLSGELAAPGDAARLAEAIARAMNKPAVSPVDFIAKNFDFRSTAEGYSRLIEGH